MRRLPLVILVSFLGIILFGLIMLRILPSVVSTMPGQLRARIPDDVLQLITTPLPTSLPTPIMADTSGGLLPEIPAFEPSRTPEKSSSTPENLNPITMAPEVEELATVVAEVTEYPTEIPAPTATETPLVLPRTVRIDGLDIIPQKFNNCGPANLTMSLNYYGHDVEQLLIGEALKPNYDDRNVSPDELVNYVLEQTPFAAAVFSGGDLILLKQLLSAGFPVIVEKGLFLNDFHGWMGHYLTLIGYDDDKRRFEILDTFLGPFDGGQNFIDYEELEARWTEFNNTFLLTYRPEDRPEIESILGPDYFDDVLMWQNAARKAQIALGRDGYNAFLWFNLGTNLTELGELTGDNAYFQSAAHAFDRAASIGLPWRMLWYQFNSYKAYLAAGRYDDVMQLTGAMLTSGGGQNVEETYYFRGLAQLAQNDPSGAVASYEKALRLNPGMQAAETALADLRGATDS